MIASIEEEATVDCVMITNRDLVHGVGHAHACEWGQANPWCQQPVNKKLLFVS